MYRFAPSRYLTLFLALALAATAVAGAGSAAAQSDTEATLQEVVVEAERQTAPSQMQKPPKANADGHTASGMQFGPLGNLDQRDIPFSFTSYTDTAIKDRQPIAINELLEDDPSVQRETARNTYFTGIEIRGLGASYIFNGQPGVYARDMVPSFEQFSRVELMKGPNSYVGSNSPADAGGLVNLVPKRATQKDVTNMTFTKLPGEARKYHLDVGKRFGKNDAFGIRVNAVTEDGELNVDHVQRERNSFAIALDHRGENHRLTLDLEQTDRKTTGAQPWFLVSGVSEIPEAPNQDRTYGQPWAEFDQEFHSMVLQGEYDLSSNWTAGAAYSSVSLEELGQWQGYGTFTSTDGDYDWATNENWYGKANYSTLRAYLNGRLQTGTITHALSLSGATIDNTFDLNAGTYNTFTSSSLDDPVYIDQPSIEGRGDLSPTTDDQNDYVSLGDRMVLSENLDVIAGLQWADITTLSASSDAVSPLAGVTYDYSRNWTLYSSYAESLEPGEQAPSGTKNAGESTDPSITENLQAGGKFTYGKLNGDVALFRTETDNAITNDNNVYGQFGRRENKGLDVTVTGKASANLSVTGGVMWNDAELVNLASSTNEGNRPIATPEFKGTMNLEYESSTYEGLSYGGALKYTGEQFMDQANTKEVPSYYTADLGVDYAFNFDDTPMTARVDVKNVTDERYWDASTIGLMPGNPRSLYLSLEANF